MIHPLQSFALLALVAFSSASLASEYSPAETLVDGDKVRCYDRAYDKDRDGYASLQAPSSLLDWAGGKMNPCPYGYVPYAGDCNDADPLVRPFSSEDGFNQKDDNCNGLIDEPRVEPYDHKKSNQLVWLPQSEQGLMASPTTTWVESEVLGSETSSRFALQVHTHTESYRKRVFLPVDASGVGRVHRTRLLSEDGKTPQTAWHYWYSPLNQSDSERKRAEMLQAAFYEFSLSDSGATGYKGKSPNGLRYGAGHTFWWCSEFYSFAAKLFDQRLSKLRSVSALRRRFRNADATEVKRKDILRLSRPGDYLAVVLGKGRALNHSTMVLAPSYRINKDGKKEQLDSLWLLEGNHFNKTIIKRRKLKKGKSLLGKIGGLGTLSAATTVRKTNVL
jgi:hypothetical protein